MKKVILLFPLIFCLFSCRTTKSALIFKREIVEAEKDFQRMTAEKGIAAAFYYFADENAVIKRENDTLIIGRNNIRQYYTKESLNNAEVSWLPDFIEVSKSGDIAYTYGKYLWKIKDRVGNTNTFSGIFHTIWKRQKDGSWKYVWD